MGRLVRVRSEGGPTYKSYYVRIPAEFVKVIRFLGFDLGEAEAELVRRNGYVEVRYRFRKRAAREPGSSSAQHRARGTR